MPPSLTDAHAGAAPAHQSAHQPADQGAMRTSPGLPSKALAWLLLLAGLVGLVAAFVLTVEKFALAADPTYVPSCSINPVLSCGSVMATPQAEVFGFPNSLLGVAGFAVLAATGAGLLAGARLAGWYWAGLQVGMTAAVVFVHWLVFQSLYRINALCPYCMVVWAVTIPAFWYLTLHTASTLSARAPAPVRRVVNLARGSHTVVLTAWFLVIAGAIAHRFWSYWSTLLP